MANYSVIVGNIGTIYNGGKAREAAATFREYREQSRDGYGRAAGEGVTLTKDGQPVREYNPPLKFPRISELAALIRSIKPDIGDEYREEGETLPGIDLTIGHDPRTGEWAYQTGDNSYSGAAYQYHNWGMCRVYRRSDSRQLARDIIDQLQDLAAYQ